MPHPCPARSPAPHRAGRLLWRALGWALAVLLLGWPGLSARAACGLLPNTYPVTAGTGVLNVNGFSYVNGLLIWGLGPSVTTLGTRSLFYPSFPSLADVTSDPSVTKLTNLTIAGGATYTFGGGTYLINGATIGSSATLVLTAATRIYVQGTINAGSGLRFNTAGPTSNGLVFLYPNANLIIGSGSQFRGVIYGPGSGNNVNIGSGSTLTGMVAVNSNISIDSTSMVFSGSDQTAIGALTTCQDSVKPTITGMSQACGTTTSVDITFSEAVSQASAETEANYSVPGMTVTSAVRSSDGLTVTLTFSSALTSSKTLSVSNVTDLAGNAIVAGSTVTLTPTPIYSGLYGQYYSQNGNKGGAYAFTGTVATRVDSQVAFSWGTAAPGVGSTPADGFSVRWTGLVKTPTTGTYGFATGSDDGVRLWINGSQLINNWSDHSYVVDSSATRVNGTAGAYLPLTLEYYEHQVDAIAQLGWQQPGQSGTTYYLIDAANLYNCTAPQHQLTGYTVAVGSASASTCAPVTLTFTALDYDGSTYTSFTGTMTVSTSSGHGSWSAGSGPAPSGTLSDLGNGSATYTFASGDAGVVRLQLSHSLAQDVTVTVSGGGFSASSGTISFRDNAFVFAEDLNGKVSGADVAVAGRPHDLTLSLIKRDPSSGSCGVATDYTGTRSLKFWRSDSGGSYTAPTVVSPALTIPSSQPASANLSLSFTAGVASLNLGTSDIGRYSLNARDDSLAYAASAITGASNTLTVRPFALLVQNINASGTANPAGSAATDAVFTTAGGNFAATVGAYAWSSAMLSNGADPGNTGTPSASATASALTAGGRTSGFASALTLSPLGASQTPAGGVLGTLSNASLTAAAYSSGQATLGSLQYSEVGSFALNTSAVVSNFLGSGLSLDAIVLTSAGAQNSRVGRFKPAGFAVSGASVSHRSAAACSAASSFTYLGEPFTLGFTLTARNAQGATTSNYTGSFAKLGLGVASAYNLAGIAGSTVFSPSASPARLTPVSASGSWSNGVASGVTLSATAERGSNADGPFSAAFGIAPLDSDGVGMLTLDLDTDSPTNGNDRASVATVPLRLGRLRLFNAIGAATRPLSLPLAAQYWSGTDWSDNTLDSCTQLPLTAISMGNLRKGLTLLDTNLLGSSITLSAGRGTVQLAAPLGGRSGTVDVALSLGTLASDASCLQPWAPGLGDIAVLGANLPHLRGAWCGSSMSQDPSARASFGLFKGADSTLHQRENY